MATTPFIHDVPAAAALAAWRAACEAAGCPDRVDTVRLDLADAVGRVTAGPVWAQRSSPSFDASAMDGIAVRAADTIGASESTPVLIAAGDYVVVDTGDPLPAGCEAARRRRAATRSSCASTSTTTPGERSCAARSRPTSTCARSARTSAPGSCCCQ